MSKFATKVMKEIKGRKRYEQLVILPDSISLDKIDTNESEGVWDQYENNVEVKYKSSIRTLLTIMDLDSNMFHLPEKKFKDVTPTGDFVKEYEFKCGDLRVFAIKIESGKLIILGGYKNQQKSDFVKFRSLKRQYLNSIANKNSPK